MELNQYISGERIQGIANISAIPLGNGNGETECGFVIDQQRNNNYKAFYYDENTNSISEELQSAKVIFVNTWTLDKFFRKIFPLLTKKYIFISHNSDMALTDAHSPYLDNDKVIKWYSQNCACSHSKAFPLPIGLGNQQYPHGNVELVNSIIGSNIQKEQLIFKNFSTGTNYSKRTAVDIITSNNGIYMSAPMIQREYFESIAKSIFCISPPGNGVDCHRIWECLYFKTIPIVEDDPCFNRLKHLPILFIKDWSEVTLDFLMKKIYILKSFNACIEELRVDYWRDHIHNLK